MQDTGLTDLSRIKRRLLLILFVVSAAIAGAGAFYYLRHERGHIAEAENLLESVNSLKTAQLNDWRKDRLERTASLIDSPVLSIYLRKFAADRNDGELRALLRARLQSFIRYNHFYSAYLTDKDGAILLSAGPPLKALCPEARKLLGRAGAVPVMGELHSSQVLGIDGMHIACRAVPSVSGRPLFLLLTADAKDFISPLTRNWPGESRTAETLLVRREDGGVLFLNELRHRKGSAMKFRVPMTARLPAAMALSGKRGPVRGTDYRGVKVIAWVDQLPEFGWGIVNKVDEAEVLEPARKLGLMVLLMVLALIAAAGAGTYAVFRVQSTLLLRAVDEALLERAKTLQDFEVVFHNSPIGKSITSLDGTVRPNKALCDMLGYTAEELSRLNWRDITRKEDIPAVEARLRELTEGGADKLRFEQEYFHKDGHGVPGDVNIALQRDENGKPQYFIISALDITDRKRAEEGLRRSEAGLKEAQRLARVGNWTLDLATNKLEWSDELFRIFELDKAGFDASYESFLGAVHPDDREAVNKAYKDSLENRTRYEITHRLLMKDGRVKYIYGFCETFYDAAGRPLKSVGTMQDITERRRMEAINSARLRLMQFSHGHSLDELLEETLNQSEALSGSQVGFYHFVDDDQQNLTLQSWSTRTKAEFCAALGKGRHYPIAEAGVWVDCVRQKKPVIHNSYAALPHKKGLPEGHVKVVRELVIPVMRDGRIKAVLGVGNKPSDYDQSDLEAVALLADLAWEIAERKQAEEALRESREMLRLFIEHSPAAIAMFDREMKYIAYSRRWLADYGLGERDLTGLSHYEVFPELPEGIRQVHRRCLEGAVERRDDDPFLRQDGHTDWVRWEARPWRRSDGSIGGILLFSEIVTQRKLAEDKLRESEKAVRHKLDAILSPDMDVGRLELSDILDKEKIQKLMDKFYALTNIGIGIIDMKGRVLVGTGWQDICTRFHRVNPETCKLCLESDLELSSGVPAGAFKLYRCKNHMWDMATPIMLGGAHLGNIFLGQFLLGDEAPDTELFREQARRYGFDEKAYLDALGSVPRWSEKTVNATMEFYAAFADIFGQLSYSNVKLANTLEERNRAQAELERTAFALRDKNQEMENFLYVTTHDLRSPLVNIQGFSQNLRGYMDEFKRMMGHLSGSLEPKELARITEMVEVKVPEALSFVLESSQKMDTLITALLKVSRVGRSELKPARLDLGKMLDSILDAMRFQLDAAGAEVETGPLPACRGDAVSINQLFTNLLDNALKYRDPARKLVVTVKGQTSGNTAVYTVSDTGRGIPRADMGKIWNIFYRPAGPGEARGEGIGLPLARRIAERNGGAIFAESEEGRGSVFRVELPRA